MTMKQTQTKMFDFSDVGLDFCVGSKNLFPDKFKKMLALGYNVQTVSSVALAGNQVTLTYGGAHGYVADRVLKVDSGTLALINGGEFWIDSVTTNTVKFTLDNAPLSVASGFTTRIASLGWSLEYENANIQVYKFKHIDDTDMYLRLCYQNVAARRNCISPCIGNVVDAAWNITDVSSIEVNRSIMSPGAGFKWDLQWMYGSTYDNYNYSNGYNEFGKAMVVGSKYHFACLTHSTNGNGFAAINAILPTALSYINRPLLLGTQYGNIDSTGVDNSLHLAQAYVGQHRTLFQVTTETTGTNSYVDKMWQSAQSFLPGTIDTFNTTTAEPLPVYLHANGQFLGYALGMYRLKYASTNTPAFNTKTSPTVTADIDLNSKIIVHPIMAGATADYAVFYALPIEEIKYD